MTPRSLLLAAAIGAAALLGCGQNQCPSQGATKCDGAQALWCMPYDSETLAGTYLQWTNYLPRPCPNFCVIAEGQAECSLTSAPVPECATDGNACFQGNIVPCVGGFPAESYIGPDGEQCAAEGETCAMTEDQSCAFCLPPDVDAAPDPACSAASAICVDSSVFQCSCGLRLGKLTDCSTDGGACVSASGGSVCALSTAADPLCTSQTIPHGTDDAPASQEQGPGWSTYCEEGRMVECFGEFDWQVTPCENCLLGSCLQFGDAGADAD